MKRSPLFFSLGASVFTVSACASPVGAVRQAVASAPEWYQEARVEIRGEGYPDVSRVVTLEDQTDVPGRVVQTRADVSDAEAQFLSEIGEAPSEAELQAALAWAASEQAAFAGAAGDSDFLSEEDLEALRGVFAVRRARP
ncbi:MAG: hypothetical protein AAF253_01695 [Pseudomonadota bacterium]